MDLESQIWSMRYTICDAYDIFVPPSNNKYRIQDNRILRFFITPHILDDTCSMRHRKHVGIIPSLGLLIKVRNVRKTTNIVIQTQKKIWIFITKARENWRTHAITGIINLKEEKILNIYSDCRVLFYSFGGRVMFHFLIFFSDFPFAMRETWNWESLYAIVEL